MKFEKVFTIASLVAFFALLPALILLEVRVLRLLPEIAYLFIIIDIILIVFIIIEVVLLARKWRKEKAEQISSEKTPPTITIEQEWGKEGIDSDQKELLRKEEEKNE